MTCTLPASHDDHPGEQRELTDCVPGSMSSTCQCRLSLVAYPGQIRRSSPRTLTVGRPRHLRLRLPGCIGAKNDRYDQLSADDVVCSNVQYVSLTPGDSAAFVAIRLLQHVMPSLKLVDLFTFAALSQHFRATPPIATGHLQQIYRGATRESPARTTFRSAIADGLAATMRQEATTHLRLQRACPS